MASLPGIGWAALAIVCLGGGLLAWGLLGRLELEGGLHLTLEYHQEDFDLAGALLRAARQDEAPDAKGRVKLDGGLSVHLRAMGGLLQVDRQGIRCAGYRLGRGRLRPVIAKRARGRRASARPLRFPRVVPKGNWRQLLPPARQALGRTWRALDLTLHLEGEYGLDDPAATGMLAGALTAWTSACTDAINARSPGSVSYRFTPVFDRTVLAFRCRIRARPRPILLIRPWLGLALHPQVRGLWWAGFRKRKQGGRKHGSQRRAGLAD